MTDWIRIIILATQGTQIWTIITLIRSTTQSAENEILHTLKLKWNQSYRHRISEPVLICSMKRIRKLSGILRKVLRNWCGANMSIFLEAPNNSSWTNTDYQLPFSDIFPLLHILKIPYFKNTLLIHPSMLYGGISGDDSPVLDLRSNTEYLQVMLSILRILLGTKRSAETSEKRERAGTRRIATTLQKHDNYSTASRHRYPNFVTD